ncbi:MAG TPA: GxxExxY protein [Candidatus Acidoferrales bacterium]|nr:GxxExxY protein [Candidatus Acidoferrales bacterium]
MGAADSPYLSSQKIQLPSFQVPVLGYATASTLLPVCHLYNALISKLDCGYRLDLLVEDRIIVELKSVENLAPIHEAIILTYLRLSGHKTGLLINFNVAVLKDGVRRFIV